MKSEQNDVDARHMKSWLLFNMVFSWLSATIFLGITKFDTFLLLLQRNDCWLIFPVAMI